ncbi:hypothetical protein [Nocardioides perillae]|uniref:Uncharacterized protein n=1 Tax=Nocardioides perillae TaxID=1119534 RepID=A0A7Y9RXX6_9ACTN|nr:hypothetical protein [Nocardioides perillae]NYG56124.1 hypothetical protein [Nocardioides perillae]
MDQRTTARSTARSSAQRVVRSLVVGQVLGGAVLATVVAGGVGPFDTLASAAGDVEVLAAGPGGASASAAGPARWGACRPVELFVDTDGTPAGWDAVVEAATERVAAESGLQLRFAGAVDVEAVTTPAEDEPAAAVLAWAGADEQPQLTTETALTTHVAHGPAGGPRHVVLAWSVVRTGASTPVDHALAELFSERHVPSPGAVAGC